MSPGPIPPAERSWRSLLELALAEDIGAGDATSPLLIEAGRPGRARIEARQELLACGLWLARAVFRAVDPAVAFEPRAVEGQRVAAGAPLAALEGPLLSLLAGERTALNFLSRLCGIATWTRRFTDAVSGTGARIVDTRKTLPGWRALDKYATAVGGALNHRTGLFDAILVKDNHVAAAGGVELAVKAVLAAAPPHLRVQVEVESARDAARAVEAGADFLLLDNLPPAELRRIAAAQAGRAVLEASGGVGLETVREIAETGVQRISIGALTHSAPGADVALELEPGEADVGGVGA